MYSFQQEHSHRHEGDLKLTIAVLDDPANPPPIQWNLCSEITGFAWGKKSLQSHEEFACRHCAFPSPKGNTTVKKDVQPLKNTKAFTFNGLRSHLQKYVSSSSTLSDH